MRERESTCDEELKNTIPKCMNQNRVLKITMIHQYKIELQERIKNQEKENNHFSRENVRENNKEFIEINMRRKQSKNKKYSNNIKLFKSCYVIK